MQTDYNSFQGGHEHFIAIQSQLLLQCWTRVLADCMFWSHSVGVVPWPSCRTCMSYCSPGFPSLRLHSLSSFYRQRKASRQNITYRKKVKEKCRFCDPFWRIPSSVGVNGLGDGSTDRVGKYWEMNWCIVGLTVVSGDMLTTTKYKHLQWYLWNVIEKTEYSTCCQIFSAIAANIGYKSSLGLIFILRCVDNVRRSTLIHWELSSYFCLKEDIIKDALMLKITYNKTTSSITFFPMKKTASNPFYPATQLPT